MDLPSLIVRSFRRFTGRDLPQLVDLGGDPLSALPYPVLAHTPGEDPIFCYGNKMALELFEMTWEEFTALPSRKSAESDQREARERVLCEVRTKGFAENYTGIRISKTGKRFEILEATIWNLVDDDGRYCGQAAAIFKWAPMRESV